MRNLYKTLCAVLAAALLALTLLPAGVLAAGADLEISAQNFPDANFRAWLTNPANLNGAGADGSLSAEELAAVTKLDLSGQNIADLTGIEHFTALESLNVSNNRLTKLDMRANTRLRYLYCATNFLTSLDVTRCAELIDLNCERNQLTTLDLSGNPKLQQLYCRHNFLSALDVSHNLELVFIETFDNQLTQFDASMLKKLRFLHIDYNRLTELDMSHNPVLEGNGFVAANNSLNRLTLPNIPDFPVEAEVFLEQNPRTGYDRTEWYCDQGYTRPIGEKDVIMATGQTVYARWVPNPYTVYYRANGGTGSMADQAVVYDQEFALTPNAFSRTGYTFDTWHTYADGIGGASYTNGQTVRNLAGGNGSRDAVYLYAQWKANAYTIQYNGNGGSGDTQATAAVYDTPANLAENGFSNSEGVFLGWARDPQAKQPEFFAGQPVKNLTADPNGTVTLYAVWMSNAALLAQKKQSALDEIEAADSTGLPAALFTAGKAALEQVDPIPKTVTVTSWPAASLVRGQALSQASLNGGKADVPGRFVWKEPDTRPQAGGSYPVVFVPADSRRYTSVEGQAALTVTEPAPAPTAAPATPTPTPAPAATPSPTKAPAAVRPTATPSATASATPSPKPTATVTPAPTATATPAPTAEAPAQSGPESGSGMGPVWLLAGGAAALLVLAAVLVLRARRGE